MSIADLERAFSDSSAQIKFTRRPDPVPADLRGAWRFSAIPLVLSRCRANSATPEQLHLLVSALRSKSIQNQVTRGLRGETRPDDLPIRRDPSLARTISILIGNETLGQRQNGAIYLADPGVAIANLVWSDESVMLEEKAFLNRLPPSMTQKSFSKILERA